ncbi:TPA: hypothetical protein N0F65_002644 [Lagenidium giganteum]|uniref:Transposase n=1 Tax=Lagenidium giganteum TaxID=4803 RepID=A0AAV2Z6M2_9STRA|nr:TPA: hypothetical protein N0F65_002644 [Lagenidium giganteum]
MPRDPSLSNEEKGATKANIATGKSCRWIARQLRRNKTAIANFKRALDCPKEPPKRGPKPKLSARAARHAIRLAIDKRMPATKIRDQLGVDCHSQTILNVLNGAKFARYKKRKQAPKLTKSHKQMRLKEPVLFQLSYVAVCRRCRDHFLLVFHH